jgi:uncharacterized MAPEG superfamily protein
MTPILQILGWTLVLALVQIMAPALARTLQYGGKWNAGPRDEQMPAPNRYAGRLARAQANLFETLPLFIAAVLIAHVAGLGGGLALLGAQIYLAARVLYVPMYAFGVPYLRGLVWLVGLGGLVTILYVILSAPLSG